MKKSFFKAAVDGFKTIDLKEVAIDALIVGAVEAAPSLVQLVAGKSATGTPNLNMSGRLPDLGFGVVGMGVCYATGRRNAAAAIGTLKLGKLAYSYVNPAAVNFIGQPLFLPADSAGQVTVVTDPSKLNDDLPDGMTTQTVTDENGNQRTVVVRRSLPQPMSDYSNKPFVGDDPTLDQVVTMDDYGAKPFGVSDYGAKPFGVSDYGAKPFGVGDYTGRPFGLNDPMDTFMDQVANGYI